MIKADFAVMMNIHALATIKRDHAIAWKNVMQEIIGEAKHRTPFEWGFNQESINPNGAVNVRGEIDIDPDNIDLDVFTTSGYGGYLEVGTRKMGPRPYIVPAVEYVMGDVGAKILSGSISGRRRDPTTGRFVSRGGVRET